MAYSPKELKAINLFMQENDCVVQLSTKPTIYFKKRGTGEEIKKHLPHLVHAFEEYDKADKLDRARARREAKRKQEQNTPYKEQYK